MKSKIKTFLFALCAINLFQSQSESSEYSSLAWHLLPQNLEELPIEFEADDFGQWTEIWLRANSKDQSALKSFMEQGLGVRWMGMEPDKNGRPRRIILVMAGKNVVDITDAKTRTGKIDPLGSRLTWNDGASDSIVAQKKRSRRKRGRGKAINFGKINLPPLTSRPKEYTTRNFEALPSLLDKLSLAASVPWSKGEMDFLYKASDSKMSLLRFQYAADCSESEKRELDRLISQEVEPKLTCWAEQNPDKAMMLVAALLQRPVVDCKKKKLSASDSSCGEASLPLADSFFTSPPHISLNFNSCKEELNSVMVHESLHLVGIKDGPEMDHAEEQAESCKSTPGQLSFDGNGEEFINDLQVETRISLFRKVREDAVEKWGWTDGEKDFVLGQICTKMGDKYCSRRFFQQAAEEYSQLAIPVPEGGEVSFKAAAHFGLYDSITEDMPRMRELARYLTYDPNGALLRRQESETHRLHEFHVARSALEKIKSNKGICSSEVDDKVFCEDLALIVKTPWFRNP